MMRASSGQNLLAIVLLIGVFMALGARLWATHQAANLVGPDHVAALADALYVHLNGSLYQLDTDGELKNEIRLSSLGIEGPLADIQVLASGDLLLGDLDQGAIRHCTMVTRACRAIAPTEPDAIKRQFKFYADESNGRLYITDTRRHRLLVQSLEGDAIEELAGRETFRFPNDVRATDGGGIYIVDTNHHRVVVFTVDGNDIVENESLRVSADNLVRSGRTWPVDAAQGPLGNWWILSADGRLMDADLVVYDADGNPKSKIALPEKADPVAITRFNNQLVLTDRELVQLYQVDPTTGDVSHFNAASFEKVLSVSRERKYQYRSIASIAMGGLVFLLIAGFALGAWVMIENQKKRRTARPDVAPSFAPMSRYQNVHWLTQDASAIEFLQKTKRQGLLIGLILVGLTISVLAAAVTIPELATKCSPALLRLIGLLVGYLLVSITMLAVLGFRVLRGRIGIDGQMLYLADHNGRTLRVAPEEVVYTTRLVAFGPLALPLKLGNGRPLYPDEEVAQHIKPLLDRAQKIGEINMMIYQIIHLHPASIASLVVLSIGAIIIFSTDVWKALF
ncbi:MAG: hypothetical protein ACE5LB_17220 [Acidiferrobacterales bacterium]